MAKRVELKRTINPTPTGQARRGAPPSKDQLAAPATTPRPLKPPRPGQDKGTFRSVKDYQRPEQSPFNSEHLNNQLLDFSNNYLKGKRGIPPLGEGGAKDLLAIHAALKEHTGFFNKNSKRAAAKGLQSQIEEQLKQLDPNAHLYLIRNNRKKILEHFKAHQDSGSVLSPATYDNEAFSKCTDVKTLKSIKSTLDFGDTNAVKAVNARIKELGVNKTNPPEEPNIFQRAWGDFKRWRLGLSSRKEDPNSRYF